MVLRFKADPDFEQHNSRADETAARELQTMLAKIRSKSDAEDLDNVYRLANSMGYSVRALKRLVKVRKEDPDFEKYDANDLYLYKVFVGMIG